MVGLEGREEERGMWVVQRDWVGTVRFFECKREKKDGWLRGQVGCYRVQMCVCVRGRGR